MVGFQEPVMLRGSFNWTARTTPKVPRALYSRRTGRLKATSRNKHGKAMKRGKSPAKQGQ